MKVLRSLFRRVFMNSFLGLENPEIAEPQASPDTPPPRTQICGPVSAMVDNLARDVHPAIMDVVEIRSGKVPALG